MDKATVISEIYSIIDDWEEVRLTDDECIELIQDKIRPFTIDADVGLPTIKYVGTFKAKVEYKGKLPSIKTRED